MSKVVIHVEKKRSWWSGRTVALCGATFEAGKYSTYVLTPVTCPQCKRLEKMGGR